MPVHEFDQAPLKAGNHGYPLREGEYLYRLTLRDNQLAAIRKLHRRLWTWFTVGLIALALVVCLTFSFDVSRLWVLPPGWLIVSSFWALKRNAGNHQRIEKIRRFYEAGLRRMRHEWQGQGISGENYVPKNHPYARDLDLFGTGSVFELMCTAQTSAGRRTLANWLLRPATLSEIQERQFAVRELRDSIDLQENWASLGRDALDQVKPASLEEWVNAPPLKFSRYAQVLAIALPIALLVTAALIRLGVVGLSSWTPVGVPLAAEGIFAACLLKKTRQAAESIVLPSFELSITAPLLDVLERAQFQSPWLRSLQLRLTRHSGRPSKQIRTLNMLAWLLDLRRSEYFALLSSLILWGTNLAILVERWRERNQQALSAWQRSLGEFEALLCFARYSYENPDHTF